MNWEPVTKKDQKIISGQIKRQPRNLHGIARRCGYRCPQVTVNAPLARSETDAQFFPTVFWLTCPEAVRRISRIEDQGFIQFIQARINQKPDLFQHFRESQLEYIYIRRSLLDPETRRSLRARDAGPARNLESVGIGGVADLRGIKCLHTHYAHYLATRNNPVGRLVEQMLKLMRDQWQCQDCHQCREHAGVAE